MSRSRAAPLAVLFAIAATVAIAWSGLHTAAFTDYEVEAEPAVNALRGGDIGGFLSLAPAYGGSLLLRAPFALAPGVWGGGDLAAYRLLAAPALIAALALGLWLWARLSAQGRPLAAWGALVIITASPLTLRGLDQGHPEELLGAVLVAAAALAAVRGRALATGLLLGLALIDKPWAALAVVPVLLALPAGRWRALLTASAVAAAGLTPFVLAGASGIDSTQQMAQSSGAIFQPWQAWWFFGAHAGPVYGLNGDIKIDYRTAPEWAATMSHPLVVLVPLAIAVALVVVRRRARLPITPVDALGLLALTLLLRCLLDTWNTAYYQTPFVLALLVWELHARRGAPYLSAAALALASLTLVQAPDWLSPDMEAIAYLLWALPAALLLGAHLLAPERLAAVVSRLGSVARVRAPSLSRAVGVR